LAFWRKLPEGKKAFLFGAKEMAQLFGIEAPHTAKQSE